MDTMSGDENDEVLCAHKKDMQELLKVKCLEKIGDKAMSDFENPSQVSDELANECLEYLMDTEVGSSRINKESYMFFLKVTLAGINGYSQNAQIYWVPGYLDLSVNVDNG